MAITGQRYTTYTTVRVSGLLTWRMNTDHFVIILAKSTTPDAAGGNLGAQVASASVPAIGSGLLAMSGEHVFTGLEKGKYYFLVYVVVRQDKQASIQKVEEFQAGAGTLTLNLINTSVVYHKYQGYLVAGIQIHPLPTTFKEVRWFLRDPSFSDPIAADTAPDHVTDVITPAGDDGYAMLSIASPANQRVLVVVVDARGNPHAATAEDLGTGATTAPAAPAIDTGNIVVDRIRVRIPITFTDTYNNLEEFQWYWSTENTAPPDYQPGEEYVMTTSKKKELALPAEYSGATKTMHVWVRAVNYSGVSSVWTHEAIDLSRTSMAGEIDIVDKLELY